MAGSPARIRGSQCRLRRRPRRAARTGAARERISGGQPRSCGDGRDGRFTALSPPGRSVTTWPISASERRGEQEGVVFEQDAFAVLADELREEQQKHVKCQQRQEQRPREPAQQEERSEERRVGKGSE